MYMVDGETKGIHNDSHTDPSLGIIHHRKFRCKDVSYSGGSSRIPESLKWVFLESNRGKEVHEPPKDKSAFKTFIRTEPEEKEGGSTSGTVDKKLNPFLNFTVVSDDMCANLSSHKSHSDQSRKTRHRSPRNGTVNNNESFGLVRNSSHNMHTKDPSISTPRHSIVWNECGPSYPSQRSPQVFLDVMMRTLGYSTQRFKTLETSYFNKPTNLQVSSCHSRLHQLVQLQDETQLRRMMSCGISPNPSTQHGDSLLHIACRSGYDASVRVMLACNASVQVSDDYGRTPLHGAFFGSTPSYEIVELIIKRDRHLLQLCDQYGATPLAYVPRDQWGIWIDFFYSKRDDFWPRRNKRVVGIEQPPRKMYEKANSQPLLDPPNALTPSMATLVVSGKLSPEDVETLADDMREEEEQGVTDPHFANENTSAPGPQRFLD